MLIHTEFHFPTTLLLPSTCDQSNIICYPIIPEHCPCSSIVHARLCQVWNFQDDGPFVGDQSRFGASASESKAFKATLPANGLNPQWSWFPKHRTHGCWAVSRWKIFAEMSRGNEFVKPLIIWQMFCFFSNSKFSYHSTINWACCSLLTRFISQRNWKEDNIFERFCLLGFPQQSKSSKLTFLL